MNKKITLTNDFHHTEYCTTKSAEEIYDLVYLKDPFSLTPAQSKWRYRVWKTLCGMDDCNCSVGPAGLYGMRSEQEFQRILQRKVMREAGWPVKDD